MAGLATQKFGQSPADALTWAMNVLVPSLVAERFARSNIVCFSTGCVYPFMPIGQLIYFMVEGEVENSYDKKKSAKYNKKTNKPVESMMWKNFLKK